MRKRTQNLVQMGCEPAKKRLFGEPAALEHLAPPAHCPEYGRAKAPGLACCLWGQSLREQNEGVGLNDF